MRHDALKPTRVRDSLTPVCPIPWIRVWVGLVASAGSIAGQGEGEQLEVPMVGTTTRVSELGSGTRTLLATL